MKKIKTNVILYIILLFLVIIVKQISLFGTFEQIWLGKLLSIKYHFSSKGKPDNSIKSVNSPVVIVTIPSNETIEKKFSDRKSLSVLYSKAFSILKKYKAKVIALNMLPSDAEIDALKLLEQGHHGSINNVIIPLLFIKSGGKLSLINPPDQNILKLNTGLGILEAGSNSRMQSISISENINDKDYQHFLLEILVKYYGIKDLKYKKSILGKEIVFGKNSRLSLQKNDCFFINYSNQIPIGISRKTQQYSIINMEDLFTNKVTEKDINGKIIILGSQDPVDRYFHLTPLGLMSDNIIYAQALYSIINGQQIRFIPNILFYLILIIIGFGCFVLFIQANVKGKPILFIIIAGGYLLINIVVFCRTSLYIDIFPFFLLLTGTFLISLYTSRERQQEQLEQHLTTFRAIIEKSLENSDSPDWGNSLLTLLCQPLNIARGILILMKEDKPGPEGMQIFCYPTVEDPRSCIYEEEIEAMLSAKKPLVAPSSFVMPLTHSSDAQFGVLKLSKRSFTSQELHMMMVLAHLTFISLYNLRLLEKAKKSERLTMELELAANIQKALLVEKAPPTRGVSLACRCIPATEVGGDYFDFVTSQENLIGIAVGDVTGHGVGAAIIMGLLRSVLRAQSEKSSSTAEVVTSINTVLYDDFVSFGKMASLFYGTYSIVDKTLTYTNAGQNPPILIRASEVQPKILKGGGPIVGFRPRVKYKEFKIKVYPGDIIAFMTDGIVESENTRKEFFGQERVEKIINENVDKSAQEILDTIFQEVDIFTEGLEQKDDMTLVIMKA